MGCNSIGRIHLSIWGAKQLLETCLSECRRGIYRFIYIILMGDVKLVVWGWVGWIFSLEFWPLVSNYEQRRPENVFALNSLQLWLAASGTKCRTLQRWRPLYAWWLMSTQTSQPMLPLELCSKWFLDKHQKSWGFKSKKIPLTFQATCKSNCRVKSALGHSLQCTLVRKRSMWSVPPL